MWIAECKLLCASSQAECSICRLQTQIEEAQPAPAALLEDSCSSGQSTCGCEQGNNSRTMQGYCYWITRDASLETPTRSSCPTAAANRNAQLPAAH